MKIGIDLGGSHISVGVITEDGKIIKKAEKNLKIEPNENIKELIRDEISSLISCVLNELKMPSFVIKQIGIGVPGITKENTIVKCEKYGIYNWNLAKEIEDFYQIPVKVQNDALCAAKAEYKYGNLQNVKKAVFLCFGTGIGGTIILDGKIFPSEIGHMIIGNNELKCHCGKKGCFETYASMRVFKEGVIKTLELSESTTSEEILNILRDKKNNTKLNNYIDDYINQLLIGLSNIINIINPEKICIGGSFTYFEDILYKRLLEKLIDINCQFEKPQIVLAKLQNTAGIIGAVL